MKLYNLYYGAGHFCETFNIAATNVLSAITEADKMFDKMFYHTNKVSSNSLLPENDRNLYHGRFLRELKCIGTVCVVEGE